MQPSPLALLKPANPPGPVSAAKAPSQETARETETGARASPRTSVPRLASLGKQVQNQVKEARRRSSEARRRRRASGPWEPRSDAGSRAGEVGCGQTRKNARAFVRVLPGAALLFTCTLPWTRRPLRGGRRRRTAGAGRGVRELPCWGGRRPCVSTDAAGPPRHWTGGKGRRTEGGLEARERCGDVVGPLAPGLGRQSSEDGRGPRAGRVAGEGPSLAAVGYITRSGVPWSALVR